MVRTTFNRLRAVKDSLPHGSMDAIAAERAMQTITLSRDLTAVLSFSATCAFWR